MLTNGGLRRLVTILVLGWAALNSRSATAEERDTFLRTDVRNWSTGKRVRVTLAGYEASQVAGAYQYTAGDSAIAIRSGGVVTPIPMRRIKAIEESLGRRHHPTLGAVVGALAGVGVGAVLAANERHSQKNGFASELDSSGIYYFGGLLGGGLLGAGIGYFVTSDEWSIVSTFQ